MFILALLNFTFHDGSIHTVPMVESEFWPWLTQWGESSKLERLRLYIMRGCMFAFSIIRIVSSEGHHLIPAWPGPLTMLAKSKKNIWVNKWTQLSQMLFCRLALPEEMGKGLRKSSGVGLWDRKNDSHENVSLWQDRWMVRLALWVETEENNEKGLPETNQPSSWFCVRLFPCWCRGSLGDLRSDVISAPLNLATHFDYCSGHQIEGWWRVILDLGKSNPW